jgi:hypothetical protein
MGLLLFLKWDVEILQKRGETSAPMEAISALYKRNP